MFRTLSHSSGPHLHVSDRPAACGPQGRGRQYGGGLARCGGEPGAVPSRPAALRSSGRQAARLFSVPHVVQQETTLAYLENQVAAALTLQSSHEYRHWLLLYTRYLVNEGELPSRAPKSLRVQRGVAAQGSLCSSCSPGTPKRGFLLPGTSCQVCALCPGEP